MFSCIFNKKYLYKSLSIKSEFRKLKGIFIGKSYNKVNFFLNESFIKFIFYLNIIKNKIAKS